MQFDLKYRDHFVNRSEAIRLAVAKLVVIHPSKREPWMLNELAGPSTCEHREGALLISKPS